MGLVHGESVERDGKTYPTMEGKSSTNRVIRRPDRKDPGTATARESFRVSERDQYEDFFFMTGLASMGMMTVSMT